MTKDEAVALAETFRHRCEMLHLKMLQRSIEDIPRRRKQERRRAWEAKVKKWRARDKARSKLAPFPVPAVTCGPRRKPWSDRQVRKWIQKQMALEAQCGGPSPRRSGFGRAGGT